MNIPNFKIKYFNHSRYLRQKFTDLTKNHKMWLNIVQTRFLASISLSIFTIFLEESLKNKILILISGYISLILILIFFRERRLKLKRYKSISDLIDVVFISILILLTGSIDTPFILFYFFPIISVSRFLGIGGSILAAFFTIFCYLTTYLYLSLYLNRIALEPFSYTLLRCLAFIGVALVSGSLTKYRQDVEINRNKILKLLINKTSLNNNEIKTIYDFVLEQMLEATNSKFGHIRLVNKKASKIVSIKGDINNTISESQNLTGYYSDRVIREKKSILITSYSNKELRGYLSGYFDPKNTPKSALFVPILDEFSESVVAILAVYSRKRDHYLQVDKEKLKGFSDIIQIIEKQKSLQYETEILKQFHKYGVNESGQPIIIINSRGYIVGFNRGCEEIWKIEASKAIGEHITEYYESEEEAKRVKNELLESENGIESFKGEINTYAKIKDTKGNVIDISLTARLIKDENDISIGSFGIFRDLETERSIKERLLEEERVKTISKVMGHYSHDVKNKLVTLTTEINNIRNYLIKNKIENAERALTRLHDVILVAVNKLSNIALTNSNIINLPNTKSVFIEAIFDEYIDSLKRRASNFRANLTINNYSEATYIVNVDVLQLRLILDNLFENSNFAIKASERTTGRNISIRIRQAENSVLIHWRDNGCGISKDDLKKVFNQRFTKKEHGTGLGLYWARVIIENHNGYIRASSVLGRWTKFTIELPMKLAPANSKKHVLKANQ